jgi:hypothetical protein
MSVSVKVCVFVRALSRVGRTQLIVTPHDATAADGDIGQAKHFQPFKYVEIDCVVMSLRRDRPLPAAVPNDDIRICSN